MNFDPDSFPFDLAVFVSTLGPMLTRKTATWKSLGNDAAPLRKALAAANIDVDSGDNDVTLLQFSAKQTILSVVDVSGSDPEQFRFVAFVLNGKYLGSASEVSD